MNTTRRGILGGMIGLISAGTLKGEVGDLFVTPEEVRELEREFKRKQPLEHVDPPLAGPIVSDDELLAWIVSYNRVHIHNGRISIGWLTCAATRERLKKLVRLPIRYIGEGDMSTKILDWLLSREEFLYRTDLERTGRVVVRYKHRREMFAVFNRRDLYDKLADMAQG